MIRGPWGLVALAVAAVVVPVLTVLVERFLERRRR